MENINQIKEIKDVTEIISNIIKGIDAGQTVIFCGAGISKDSGLPIVKEFIPYFLLKLCFSDNDIEIIINELEKIIDPEERFNELIKIISEKMRVSQKIILTIINNLPFEDFLQSIQENSIIDELLNIYNQGEPNTNHILLAKLIKTGKVRTIITTNFDRLIEKALGMEPNAWIAGKDYDVLYKEEDFKNIINCFDDRIRIIKIHGSVDDKETMAITLKQVASQILSEARNIIIKEIFSKGKHANVLVLGYSSSDMFDLSPQIQAIENNYKKVYYVQHSEKSKVEPIQEQIDKNPFRKFEVSQRLYYNTGEFVEKIWKSIFDKNESYELKTSQTNWKKKIDEWYKQFSLEYKCIVKHSILGHIFIDISEFSTAIEHYEQSLNFTKEFGDKKNEGAVLNNIGNVYAKLGEHYKAIEYYKQALEIAKEIGNKQSKGNWLGNLGAAYCDIGENNKAIEYYEQALEIAKEIGDKQGESTILGHYGTIYEKLGEYNKALEYSNQSLLITKVIGDKKGEGICLGVIGNTYESLGDYYNAMVYYEQALDIAKKIGNKRGEGVWYGSLGIIYSKEIRGIEKAIDYYKKALKIAKEIGDKENEEAWLGNLGVAYFNIGEYKNALEYYEQAVKIAKEIGDKRGEGIGLGNLGNTYGNLGEYEKAIEYYIQALEIALIVGDKRREGSWLENLGTVYEKLGEFRKAIEYYEQSLCVYKLIFGYSHPYTKRIENNLRLVKSKLF